MMFDRGNSADFRLRTRAAGALLALCAGLFTDAANAQPTPDAANTLPMVRYREAHAAMERNDWQEARLLLLELWERSKSYDVAASLGEVEHALGNDVSAARYLSFAVAHLAPKERPETLTRYRAALSELEAQVGRLQVIVSEEAAEVRIDGNLVGLSPLSSTIFVTPGEHTVEARAQGSVASNRIEVNRGSSAIVELALAKPAPEVAPGSAAPTPNPVPARVEIPVPAPAASDRAETTGSRSSIPLVVGGGLTLVGLGTAIGFGVAANSAETKARTLKARLGPDGCSSGAATQSACDAANHAVDVQRRDATLSMIGVGVASAGAIATVGYLLFWPKPKPSTYPTSFRPSAQFTRTAATLTLAGDF
jgi:hypothetical protein